MNDRDLALTPSPLATRPDSPCKQEFRHRAYEDVPRAGGSSGLPCEQGISEVEKR
jgi:hypothetical protein